MTLYWLFFILESLVVNLFLPEDALALGESAYIMLICVNTLILLLVLCTRYAHDRNFMLLIMGGLLLRIFFLFWSEYFNDIFALPNAGADEFTYYYNAMSALVKDKEFTGYALLFSWQARIYGLSKVYGKFVNVLFSVSAITILRKMLIRLDVKEHVRTVTEAFACFLPNFAICSALLLRESLIVFWVAVSAYYLICWWQEDRFSYLLLALAASVGAAWLHSGMIAYTIGIVCVAVSARMSRSGRYFRLLSARTIVLSVLTTVVLFAVLMNLDIGLTSYFRGADSIEDIVSIADAYEDGGSSYNANIVSNESLAGFVINTPFRMLYFLFAPMPWDWRGATDAIAFLMSGLFYGYVFFRSLPYAVGRKRNALISALFLISLLALMIFGWGVSNSGTALRHRDKMVIHDLLMLALIKNEEAKGNRRRLRSRDHEI